MDDSEVITLSQTNRLKLSDVRKVLVTERECINRQDTPKCNRKCQECDLVLPRTLVYDAYDTAIALIDYITTHSKGE